MVKGSCYYCSALRGLLAMGETEAKSSQQIKARGIASLKHSSGLQPRLLFFAQDCVHGFLLQSSLNFHMRIHTHECKCTCNVILIVHCLLMYNVCKCTCNVILIVHCLLMYNECKCTWNVILIVHCLLMYSLSKHTSSQAPASYPELPGSNRIPYQTHRHILAGTHSVLHACGP